MVYSRLASQDIGILAMGIYDRDWYKDDAKQRFQSSPSLKAQREHNARSKFERYTNSLSIGSAHQTNPGFLLSKVLVWLGLGALCFALFSWISAPKLSVTGNQVEVVIPKSQDGHHYIDGVLNGKHIRFLVDTGASYVSIGANLAAEMGLLAGKPTRFETANGSIVGQLFENQSIQVGGLVSPPLTVGVMPNAPNTALLGQNFLRHVEILQVDNKLILRGRYAGLPAQATMKARAKTSMYAGLAMLFLAWLSSFAFIRGRQIK